MTFTEKRISSTFIFNMSKQVCQDIGINKQTPAKTLTLESRPVWAGHLKHVIKVQSLRKETGLPTEAYQKFKMQ